MSTQIFSSKDFTFEQLETFIYEVLSQLKEDKYRSLYDDLLERLKLYYQMYGEKIYNEEVNKNE